MEISVIYIYIFFFSSYAQQISLTRNYLKGDSGVKKIEMEGKVIFQSMYSIFV